jgi:hypothetical protein
MSIDSRVGLDVSDKCFRDTSRGYQRGMIQWRAVFVQKSIYTQMEIRRVIDATSEKYGKDIIDRRMLHASHHYRCYVNVRNCVGSIMYKYCFV